VKKSGSLVGRAIRCCASRADSSRPFDTKPVLCRIILMSSNQAAPLRGAGSGAPGAGLWPWEAPPGAPAPSRAGRCPQIRRAIRQAGAGVCGAAFLAPGCPARGHCLQGGLPGHCRSARRDLLERRDARRGLQRSCPGRLNDEAGSSAQARDDLRVRPGHAAADHNRRVSADT